MVALALAAAALDAPPTSLQPLDPAPCAGVLDTLFNATAVSSRFKDGGLERRYAPFVSEHGAGFPTAEQPDELVMFTVVREPIQTAFDAYLEVIHRTKFPRAQNDAETSQLDVELYHEFLHATNGSALRSFVNWGQGRGKKSPPPAWRMCTLGSSGR